MAITIPRTPLVDDDGSGTTGTIINNAWQTSLYDAIDVALAQVPAPGGSGAHSMLSAAHTDTVPASLVQGDLLAALGGPALARVPIGAPGQVLTVVAGVPAWTAPPSGSGGGWIDVAFNAANFFTNNANAWTVEAADQGTFAYAIVGTTMHVWWEINTTSVPVAVQELRIRIPAGKVAARQVRNLTHVVNAGTHIQGIAYVLAGQTYIVLQQFGGVTNWAVSVNNTFALGQLTLPIQP